jgi:hypothetical protein
MDQTTDSVFEGHMYADDAVTRAERACQRGDSQSARKFVESARAACGELRAARLTRYLQALDFWIAHLDGLNVDIDEAVLCLTSHQCLNSEGGSIADVEILVAMKLLAAANRSTEARELLDRYVADYRRRVRAPLERALQELAFDLGWIGDSALIPATRQKRAQSQASMMLRAQVQEASA